MPQGRREGGLSVPAPADRQLPHPESDFEELFATGEAVHSWEALSRQPIAALVRPPAPDDPTVPVVEMSAGHALDTIAQEFAASDPAVVPSGGRAPTVD
jgi:hypothetical protein